VTVRVKICGVTCIEDAEAAILAGADLIGLNFYQPSPRYLERASARAIRQVIGHRAQVVGVFVNEPRSLIDECARELGLDLLQFHGDEEESALSGWTLPVIRALRVRSGEALAAISGTRADYILLDTFSSALYGGSGVARPLEELRQLDLSRVFISGGLNASNVAAAAALGPYAVDAASGVESTPGIKDHLKLRSFVSNAKSAR